MSDETEMWETYMEVKRARERHEDSRDKWKEKELELLDQLVANADVAINKVNSDGADGHIYVLNLITPLGTRLVDFWNKTGRWRARKGKAQGHGIYSMARYYRLSLVYDASAE